MKSRDYWAKRQEALTESLLNKGEEYYKSIATEYQRATNNIEEEVNKFYGQFAVNNQITFAEAKKILTTKERKKFQMDIDKYIKRGKTLKYSDKWAKKLENASTVYRISRLQSLQFHMHQAIEELIATHLPQFTSVISSVYAIGYYRQLHELAKGTEAAVRFDRINENFVNNLIARPWAADGKNFSTRIWGAKDNLINHLDIVLVQGLMRGQSRTSIISEISDRMGVSRSDAGRLVMTETAFISSAATNDAYKTHGVEEFEFLATLDKKTSNVCREMDGIINKMSDYKIGTTAPPLHSRCRSTTLPVVEDYWDEEEPGRAARDSEGRYTRVPGNITYNEWFNEYANQ
jgi:SPP1 gp7 family putative phage head morphogenesis protein